MLLKETNGCCKVEARARGRVAEDGGDTGREAGGLGGSGLKVVPTTEYQKSEYRVGNRREGRYATQQTKQQPTLYVCRNDGV
ncbi:hypothetical protein GBA52_012855 [Prunus armeniaca]|nr:hypothetical protein GBA52_012855 [Prunus armeniaca]